MASNSARKAAARAYQKQHPGTPYPEALRLVARSTDDAPLSAVVSSRKGGKSMRCNLEEIRFGGDGPHLGIAGATGSGKSNLISVMAGSMLQSPPARGVQITTFVGDVAAQSMLAGLVRGDCVAPADQESYLGQLLDCRDEQLRARGWDCNRGEGAEPLPAAVVIIYDPPWARHDKYRTPTPVAVKRALRVGRSLDVHLVVTWQPARNPDFPWVPAELDSHLSSIIRLQGPPGQGTWERRNFAPPAVAAITIPEPRSPSTG